MEEYLVQIYIPQRLLANRFYHEVMSFDVFFLGVGKNNNWSWCFRYIDIFITYRVKSVAITYSFNSCIYLKIVLNKTEPWKKMFTKPLSTNDLEIESEGYLVQDPLGTQFGLGT